MTYEQAGEVGEAPLANLSDSPLAMAMLCDVLRHKGRFEEALEMGLAATRAAPHDIEVRDLVASSLSRGVPKWHRPMLHDSARNAAYAAAIRDTVEPNMVVLEIGTGAGLLSLLAAQRGAHVYTCEANGMVAAAAKLIAARNGFSERIHVIPKMSSQLEVGVDLPRRADLLMSELFDDTLFGDGIVEYIADAQARLLQPNAIVLPQRSCLRVALVEFEFPAKHRSLADVENFDLSPFNVLAPQTSELLRARKHGAILKSPAKSALAKNYCLEEPFGSDRDVLELVSTGGRVSGVAQWLRIEFSGDNVFENTPMQEHPSHWGSPLTVLSEPLETVPGQIVRLHVRRIGRRVLYRLRTPEEPT